MTIAHLSDTHLGFRAYGRTTPGGFNQREADVMNTFQACLDAIAERDPDLVVHAGDFFHVVRPSNATIVAAYRALSGFQAGRSGKPFLLIGGNHDTPRTADSGNILRLFAAVPGVHLMTHRAGVVDFPTLDAEALCVPSYALLRKEPVVYEPTLGRRYALLALHGLAKQAIPDHAQFDLEEVRHDRWTYVALGDYHSFQTYGANVCYPGSTDFTSSNIWEEIPTPKGWVWFDAETGRMEFNPLQPRRVLDLPRIDARDLTPEQIQAHLVENAQWPDGEMPIVRQRIVGAPLGTRGRLDPNVVRGLANRALAYQLALQPRPAESASASRESAPAVTLEQSWEAHVAEANVGVPKTDLAKLGLDLLKEVSEREASSSAA